MITFQIVLLEELIPLYLPTTATSTKQSGGGGGGEKAK